MYEKIEKVLRNEDNFLITAHINPEGDSLGSCGAVENVLKILGKNAFIVCQDPVPESLAFLGVKWIERHTLKDKPFFDWAIVLDTPSIERTGTVSDFLQGSEKIITIDHHVSNKAFGKYNAVDPNASSCGEMVCELIEYMGISYTPEIAALLYVAISTDTGSFRFQNTHAKTHRHIANLLEAGINLGAINEQLYSNIRLEKIALQKKFLNRITFHSQGRIGYSFLRQEDFDEACASTQDAEGLVNLIRDIRGVDIAFIAVEREDCVKVSFRSKNVADVNALAREFGGGGHVKAAGASLEGTLEEAIERILQTAERMF